MRVLHVVGARPNYMKVAPVVRAMEQRPAAFEQAIVHTGQHYDANMSALFFDELGLPRPTVNLEVGSGSHAWQTAQVMLRFEPVVADFAPDWVVVVGDVNSTLACTLVAAKAGVCVAHVEAGLRSRDRSMPEELNRILTDQLAHLLLTPSRDAGDNLRQEGVAPERICFVGNVMIDTLHRLLPQAEARWPQLAARHAIQPDRYALVTLHRPANVDAAHTLEPILHALAQVAQDLPVVFPMHPRTRARLDAFGFTAAAEPLCLVGPVGYLDFLALQAHARVVLTDSGGVQEETTVLGTPCLTLRDNTERPITIEVGTNQLVGRSREAILAAFAELRPRATPPRVPELWDGHAAERVVAALQEA